VAGGVVQTAEPFDAGPGVVAVVARVVGFDVGGAADGAGGGREHAAGDGGAGAGADGVLAAVGGGRLLLSPRLRPGARAGAAGGADAAFHVVAAAVEGFEGQILQAGGAALVRGHDLSSRSGSGSAVQRDRVAPLRTHRDARIVVDGRRWPVQGRRRPQSRDLPGITG
jgi:hypothetical protein